MLPMVTYVNRSPNQIQFQSLPRSSLATVECQRWATVASRLLATGTSTLWISTNITNDADSDCSRTIVGTLLLFTFTKKASTIVNVDIIASFHSLGWCHFELAPRHPGHRIVSSNESANG